MFNFLKNTSYTFEGKKEQENVVLFLHRHWYVLVGKVSVILIMSLVPILLLILFGQLILAHKLIPLFTFLWAAYIMALWYYLFYALTMYTLDYWIVTDERIVNNLQRGFFNRNIAELSIHMIQDVSVKLVGMIPTMLNFGTVEVQTAAEEGHFKLQQVPKPQLVKDKIMEIIEETEEELGPRMHGMTQRHHFHPDKYVIQRISEHTKDKLTGVEESSPAGDKETQLKRQIEQKEEEINLSKEESAHHEQGGSQYPLTPTESMVEEAERNNDDNNNVPTNLPV